MQNGGGKGVELDDIHVTQTIMENEPLGLSPFDAES